MDQEEQEFATKLGPSWALISLNKQLVNHGTTVAHIARLLGSEEAAANYLRKCIYYVGMGTNDYINNYLIPQSYTTSQRYTPQQYATVLIQQYSQQLRSLYEYQARNVAISGLGPLGCIPLEVATYGPSNKSGCVDKINKDVQLFNDGLNVLVEDLNNDLLAAKFIYINITAILSRDLSGTGITVTNATCCVISTTVAKGQCAPNQVPCSNRNSYVFWDAIHPTEIVYRFVGADAYKALKPLIPTA